ncbi:HTH domain-containing protein [Sporosarcina phage Lietuvens]|nr:HTH domain-containing protein [Sporosarcina phage Lietuvens]
MAKKLTDKQYAAITLLSLPKRGGLTYEQVAEQVGVTRKTLAEWRRKDEFNDELKREIVRTTLDSMPDIMASIPAHIINDGNAALFRTLLQAHGMLTDKVEVETKGSGSDVDAIKARLEDMRRKDEG